MSARKPIGSIYLDSSAFIPLLETTHTLHNKAVVYLKTRGALPSIDAVVLSEVLAGCDPSIDRDALAEKYTKQFRVPSFDARAARVCSELFRILKAAGQIPSKKQERQITKADLMILATVMTNRASEFVFEDKHFAQYPTYLSGDICGFALPKFTRLSDLPDVMVQTEIPGLDTEQGVSDTLKQEGKTNP